ncbi:MAG TPA: peptidylprolyl isomerase [Candidatus Wujingus californicus]|uniref:peptidylprolyl isomerase n=1 Tax=Candidatus Wujingus californicus TaxID=3367618 RepID=UPI001DACD0B1|nr:peptidylprolyl isomerase [Planctomycetota bacterium]MDO8131351.1 peptidylprolyl isomerase [Candidatus Brocadiales bacterium]
MRQIIKLSNLIILVLTEIILAGSVFGDIKEMEKPAKAEKKTITDKNIVAIVNNQKITKQELYSLLVDAYGEDALDVLIRRTLIFQEAEKKGVSITDSEVNQRLEIVVDAEINALMRQYRIKEIADLEKELAKVGTNVELLRDKLLKKMRKQAEIELLAEKVMIKTITITEEELRDVYEQEYGEKIEASQIVLKTRSDADDVLKKLKSGADFSTIAKNLSIDRVTALKSGKMQPFSPKDSLGVQITHLKISEISDIIKTDYGYHIIKITGRKPAGNKDFKSVRGELEKIAKDQRYRERLKPWLINLIENASITKNLTTD